MPRLSHLHRLRASLIDSLQAVEMEIEAMEKLDKPKVKRDLRQERIDKYKLMLTR